jgi:hypothetical protein
MTKTTKRAALNVPEPDRREGYTLAIAMLRELEASTDLCDACLLDEFVTGRAKPQDNIVYRYLVKCRACSLDVAAGFCAVLSDFVSNSSEGFTLKATDYQKGLKIRVPGRVSKEVERLRTWKSIQRNYRPRLRPHPARLWDGRMGEKTMRRTQIKQAPLRRGFLFRRPRRTAQERFKWPG